MPAEARDIGSSWHYTHAYELPDKLTSSGRAVQACSWTLSEPSLQPLYQDGFLVKKASA